MEKSASSNPLEHTANIKKEFIKLSEHLREDIEKINDPKAKALFQTSAEVIDGLTKAFDHYEQENETAWINENPLKA